LVNAFCCSGFYGLTSFFPIEQIIALSTGQGISGILMNAIGYIVIASVNTNNEDNNKKYGAIIFFSISGFILLVNLIILLFAFKTEYFQYYLSKTKDFKNDTNKLDNEGITTRSTGGSEKVEELVETEPPAPQNSEDINFFGLFGILYDVDLLSGFIYVITFALFPSVSISQRLFDFHKYRAITIITIYNVFDTIGRSVVSKIKPSKILSYIVICGRSILLFTLIFNHYLDMKSDTHTYYSISLMVNVAILALTNGIGTSLCFGLAPTLVPDELKGRAGGSIGFFNILGIFIGTCVAFLTKHFMKLIGEYKD
jgi:MFS family permease